VAQECADSAELEHLRRLYQQESARVRELESSQRQLEIHADDLQRTFHDLRRQLTHMSELHKISTILGSVLEPTEVMTRTLEGLGRLVEHDLACIYVVEDGSGVRRVARGSADRVPPRKVKLGQGPLGRALAGADAPVTTEDGLALTVPMRVSGAMVGVLHLVRERGDPLTDQDRKLAELLAAEAAAPIRNARLYEQTRRLATTDPQTGLFNFRHFHEALSLEIARGRRLGYVVGLLMVDVDDFKQVNDTYGHQAGDKVLRDIADVLRRNLRRTDVLARYGGEEFAIILPGLGLPGVSAVGEKLRRAVRALSPAERPDKPPLQVTISVGGVSRAPLDADVTELVRDADAALYEAKRRGKDSVYALPG
jgi:two-component system, cell cycle response regulator